jgi:8-oxo-dGTP pyrophosphatase MutT (NUDIX family)
MSICSQKYPKKSKKIAGVIVFHRPSRRILLLLKANGKWDLPKGHVEPGEKFIDAAKRECWEETGLRHGHDLEIYPYNYISIASKSFLRFYLGYTDDGSNVRVSHEHADHHWATPEEALDIFGGNNHFSQIIRAMYILSYC